MIHVRAQALETAIRQEGYTVNSSGYSGKAPKYLIILLLMVILMVNLPIQGLPNSIVITNIYLVPDKYQEVMDTELLSPDMMVPMRI